MGFLESSCDGSWVEENGTVVAKKGNFSTQTPGHLYLEDDDLVQTGGEMKRGRDIMFVML